MFHELVKKARSYRRFVQAEAVPEAVLRELVDMARIAPCGGNGQPLRYRIVSDAAECAAIFPLTAWAGALSDWPGPAEGERPTGYIAICAESGKNPAIDLGIAAQIIQLGATDLGYGVCQLGSIQRKEISTELGLSEDYHIMLLIAVGKPAETVVLEPMPADGNTAYWRTPDDVHHVPKRSLDEVLL